MLVILSLFIVSIIVIITLMLYCDMEFLLSPNSRFRATLYQCPDSVVERNEMVANVETRINDLQTVS